MFEPYEKMSKIRVGELLDCYCTINLRDVQAAEWDGQVHILDLFGQNEKDIEVQ